MADGQNSAVPCVMWTHRVLVRQVVAAIKDELGLDSTMKPKEVRQASVSQQQHLFAAEGSKLLTLKLM
eukprot:COSAG02_NODE_39174_length_420_cov_0.806854_1_plen_67_part_10